MLTSHATDFSLAFPILIGDIGGTNARFSLLETPSSEVKHFANIRTADYPTIDAAIEKGIFPQVTIKPQSTILAVAGPIKGDDIPLTNCAWVVRPKDMIDHLGLRHVLVVNDFEAQALAVAVLSDEHREKIGGSSDPMMASRVVLGPGTGLGVGGLVYAQETWIPVPGEGGHVDLGPRSQRDFEIFPHLQTIEGRISGEQILCGRGLVNLYRAICAADGVEPLLSEPAQVTAQGLSGADNRAAETVSLFSTYLGRVAGDMALVFMARGGVYLAGGISQKILPALKQPEFRQAFEDKAPHSALLKTIPTYVVTHPLAAIEGLSAYARMPKRFGLSTQGRSWRY